MKKYSKLALYFIATCLLLCFQQCGNNENNELAKEKTTTEQKVEEQEVNLVSVLQDKVADSIVAAFSEVLKNANNDPLAIQSLGHYAYLNRELDIAAWLYALSENKKPGDINNQSNLALCLHEMSVADPLQKDLLQRAISILENASVIAPGNAAVQNNLGFAYFQQYLNSNDSSFLLQAEDFFNRAITINPNNSVFYSHLADVKKAQQKNKEAIKNLNKAFKLSPYDGVFINSTKGFTEYTAATSTRSFCDSINFNCKKNCPPSIIGQINYVTCEMSQQDARFDCAAGRPYAISFNCDDKIPSTGFMIPGLHSGVGIITPWGKLAFLVQGGGNIDIAAEISTPVPFIRFTGSGRYNPSSGMSVTDFGTQFSLNLYNKGIIAPELNKLNLGPIGLKLYRSQVKKTTDIQLEVYETAIVHIH